MDHSNRQLFDIYGRLVMCYKPFFSDDKVSRRWTCEMMIKSIFNSRRTIKTPVTLDPDFELKSRLPDSSKFERDLILETGQHTMTSPERLISLVRAIEYLNQNRISGDIVECGVWRGGSIYAAAKTLLNACDTSRNLWLYDTFDGMSSPTASDVDFLGQAASELLARDQRDDPKGVWCQSQLEQVRHLLEKSTYPVERLKFVIGKVENTLLDECPERISLLRLDTDWYESTRVELEILFPKLVPGGVLIIDDYGHWQGCRQAVDEYFFEHRIQILLSRIDYTGRIAIKQ